MLKFHILNPQEKIALKNLGLTSAPDFIFLNVSHKINSLDEIIKGPQISYTYMFFFLVETNFQGQVCNVNKFDKYHKHIRMLNCCNFSYAGFFIGGSGGGWIDIFDPGYSLGQCHMDIQAKEHYINLYWHIKTICEIYDVIPDITRYLLEFVLKN